MMERSRARWQRPLRRRLGDAARGAAAAAAVRDVVSDAGAHGAEQTIGNDRLAERIADIGEKLADLRDIETGDDDDLRQHVRLRAVEILHDVGAADLRKN